MQICFIFVMLATLTACTFNFSLITTCTHGYANDVVDDTATDTIDPQLSVPVKGI